MENNYKGVEEIYDAVVKQAMGGSCKTCRWRVSQEPYNVDRDNIITHYCMLQGNVSSIDFTDADLEREPYPWICEYSKFLDDNYCFAFQPKPAIDVKTMRLEASKHRDFMTNLKRAVDLYLAIKEGELDELIRKLNDCI